ncbi:MAG: AAA family ATPase [Chitinophagaceae bacterium]|nr:AAA family ATPase [Chitinophagaceae bacterium]
MMFPAILRNWYWFIVAAALGLGLAMAFNKLVDRSYRNSMTLLIQNDPHQSPMNSSLDNLNIKEKTINIQDEQTIVSAYSLQLKTLQNLNWQTSIYKKSLIGFGKKDLYRNEPFRVVLPDGQEQKKNVPVTIHVLPGGNYTADCDYHYKEADSEKVIQFTGKGALGTPFNNDWFHFTLDTTAMGGQPEVGSDYVLIINDIPQMAIDYQSQLAAKIPAPESNVLTVELKGANVQRNVDYLNALGEAYRKFGLDQKNQSAINTIQFIRNQIAGVADSLQASGNRFTKFRTNNRIVDLSQEGTLVLQKAEEVGRQENALKLKINYYKELNNHLGTGEDLKGFVAPAIGDPDPDLSALVQKLTLLFSQREALRLTAQAKNPKLIALNNDVELTQQLIRKNINGLQANAEYELNSLEQQKSQTNSRLSGIPQTERELLDIKRGFDVNSQLYNFLLQKRAEAGIALASNSPYVQILDQAAPETTEPIGLKPVFNLAIGALLGFLVTLGIILLRQYTDKRLKDPESVQEALVLSVAGIIPHNRSSTDLPVTAYPDSAITESFRGLRTNLRHLLKGKSNAVIAVHSMKQAEGKSFIAVNTASILALSGKKVLLVELDKRSSQVEGLIGAGKGKDLSDYLNGVASFGEIVSTTQVKCLSFVRAVKPDIHLAELMDTPPMERFIKEARASFDYIVVDNSPVGILSEGKVIASYAEVNLFVLKMGFSTVKELSDINRTAEEETIPNMAVVLNDIPHRRGAEKKSGYFTES